MTELRTEELLNEGTVEAVETVVENVAENVAENGGSIDWSKLGKAGLVVGVLAGAGYVGYKFYKKKKAEKNVDEESNEEVVVDAECKETSEEVSEDSEK